MRIGTRNPSAPSWRKFTLQGVSRRSGLLVPPASAPQGIKLASVGSKRLGSASVFRCRAGQTQLRVNADIPRTPRCAFR